MLEIRLETKQDITLLKTRLRKACDALGIRLGKEDHNANNLIAKLFAQRDYNTFVSAVTQPASPVAKRRHHDNRNRLIKKIGAGPELLKRIKTLLNAPTSKSRLTFGLQIKRMVRYVQVQTETECETWEILDSDDERFPVEFLNELFLFMMERNALHLIRSKMGLPGTEDKDIVEALSNDLHAHPVFPDWKKFMFLFSENTGEPNDDLEFAKRFEAWSNEVAVNTNAAAMEAPVADGEQSKIQKELQSLPFVGNASIHFKHDIAATPFEVFKVMVGPSETYMVGPSETYKGMPLVLDDQVISKSNTDKSDPNFAAILLNHELPEVVRSSNLFRDHAAPLKPKRSGPSIEIDLSGLPKDVVLLLRTHSKFQNFLATFMNLKINFECLEQGERGDVLMSDALYCRLDTWSEREASPEVIMLWEQFKEWLSRFSFSGKIVVSERRNNDGWMRIGVQHRSGYTHEDALAEFTTQEDRALYKKLASMN